MCFSFACSIQLHSCHINKLSWVEISCITSVNVEHTYMRSFPVDVRPRWRWIVVEQRVLGRREVWIFPQCSWLEAASLDRVVRVVVVVSWRSVGDRARRTVPSIADRRPSYGSAVIDPRRPTANVRSSWHFSLVSNCRSRFSNWWRDRLSWRHNCLISMWKHAKYT